MKKPPTLLDQLPNALHARGPQPWHTTLPPAIRDELHDIRARFQAKTLPGSPTKHGLAKALSTLLKARGVTIGHQGVLTWLEKSL